MLEHLDGVIALSGGRPEARADRVAVARDPQWDVLRAGRVPARVDELDVGVQYGRDPARACAQAEVEVLAEQEDRGVERAERAQGLGARDDRRRGRPGRLPLADR